MAEVLVLVEHADGEVKKVTLELLTAARTLGPPSAVVLGGPGVAAPLKARLAEYGAAKVYVGESEDLDAYLGGPKAEVLAALVERVRPAALLVASTAEARDIHPRSTPTGYAASAKPVAAILAGQSGAVLSITSPLTGFVSCTK